MERYYRLDGLGHPVRELDPTEWGRWVSDPANHPRMSVAVTVVGHSKISTLFLGIDSSGSEPPLLWETRVEGGPYDGKTVKYDSAAQARLRHADMVKCVNAAEHGGKVNGWHQ